MQQHLNGVSVSNNKDEICGGSSKVSSNKQNNIHLLLKKVTFYLHFHNSCKNRKTREQLSVQKIINSD